MPPRPSRRSATRAAGLGLAVATAAVAGFAAASLLLAGPRELSERTPVALARALVGDDVGRDADGPLEIPPAGWVQVIRRTAVRFAKNRLMAEAAAVTFFSLLALFPALTVAVSLYGLFADPAALDRVVDALRGIVPQGGLDMLHGQVRALVQNGQRGLSVGVAVGLAATLWSANQGSKALFETLNVIYREEEERSYPYFVVVAFGFTLTAIVFVIAATIGVVLLPTVLSKLGLSDVQRDVYSWLRWPVILVVVTLFLSFLYRFGPSREDPKWRWVTLGGGLAAVSWVVVSFAFSWYVQRFGSFDRTYGSLGTVVGFMVWLWLSTLVALGGAQLDSELEHQTARDTTTGDPRPLGWRGATQADSVA